MSEETLTEEEILETAAEEETGGEAEGVKDPGGNGTEVPPQE